MLSPTEAQQILVRSLAGVLPDLRPVGAGELRRPLRRLVAAVAATVAIAGRDVEVCVAVDDRFPATAPSVFVDPVLGAELPHVERDGRVCYMTDEGVRVDDRAPDRVVVEALSRALRTIREGLEGANHGDFLDELESHWEHRSARASVPCYIEPDDRVRAIVVGRRGSSLCYFADATSAVREFRRGELSRPPEELRALYVPTSVPAPGQIVRPSSFTSAGGTRAFVEQHIAADMRRELFARTNKQLRREEIVVLGIGRQGGRALVALAFQGCERAHPLRPNGHAGRVELLALERRDRGALAPRGGALPSLTNRHIVIAGCGSVGGHLATMLASAGVGRLTLVDPDRLSAANAYRHVLGASAIGELKVQALKRDLECRVPYVSVRPLQEPLERAWDTNIATADLLILATGSVASSLGVNDRVHSQGGPPLVTCWLEPLGIGGHAVATNVACEDHSGCLRCLFPSIASCRADFAAPGQQFVQNAGGCGNQFTPYGDLDARRTAEIAARLSLRVLVGEVGAPQLVSWKGDADEFRAHGYRLSERFALEAGRLVGVPVLRTELPACETCRGLAA